MKKTEAELKQSWGIIHNEWGKLQRDSWIEGYLDAQEEQSLKWSDEPPTEPGWYWYKSEWDNHPFKVIRFYGKDDMEEAIKNSDRWAGPIPEPIEEE
jgi:hypothetical protein